MVYPTPWLKLADNTYYVNFATSTVDLDANSIVAGRKIDLEFKEVVTQALSNGKSGQSGRADIKDAEIFNRYSGPIYQEYQVSPIGKGSYTVVNKAPRPAASYNYSSRDKLEKKYGTKILASPGSFIDKIC